MRDIVAIALDEKINQIQNKFKGDVVRIFKNIATDANAVFRLTNNIDSKTFAKSYIPDFTSIARNISREAIEEFKLDFFALSKALRANENLSSFINNGFNFQSKELIKELIDGREALENVIDAENAQLVSKLSEDQAKIITKTNEKMLDNSVKKAKENYLKAELLLLEEQRQLRIAEGFADSPRKNEIDIELSNLRQNQNKFLADEITSEINKDAEFRSDLITYQIASTTEATSRYIEAEAITTTLYPGLNFFDPNYEADKEWVSVLDSSTRPAHFIADGQRVPINDKFFVDSEYLNTPRDPSGSPSNIIRCRCYVIYHFRKR